MAALPITYSGTIPEEYRDVMGHMNVMWYTHVFDKSVFGLFEQVGLDLAYMQRQNSGSFALESHTRYLAEVHVGEQVEVRTRVLGRTAKRFHLLGFLVNLSQTKLAATFEVVGCYIDMSTRRMAPIPADVTDPFDALAEQHGVLPWPSPTCGFMQP